MGRADPEEPFDQAADAAAQITQTAEKAEKITRSVQAAHMAAAASKTGGAVSGTAVGTAMGGPLGAVIGTLAGSRKFWQVLGAIFCSFLLFGFILANSISLIFTYLGFESADSYVAEARTAECGYLKQRIEELFQSQEGLETEIQSMIGEKRDEVFAQISDDFSENWNGYDDYEVTDEYELLLKGQLSTYLSVLMEETWSGAQINSFMGAAFSAGFDTDLSSGYDEYFSLAAATYQVPEGLLKAIAKAESDFDPNAVSPAGAIGIMQLMPATAAGLGVDPYDPKQNIMGGAKYISQMLNLFSGYSNSLELAVAAYNAGPGAVKKAGYRVPQNEETPAYVKKVLGYLNGQEGSTGDNVPSISEEGGEAASALLLKELIQVKGDSFFGWSVTGTHTETIPADEEDEEEEEIEIVDYRLVVKLDAQLSETQAGYSYRYVTDQTTFRYVLKLFELLQYGKDSAKNLIHQVISWKNFVFGAGASEDIYAGSIDTGGDTISYDTVSGCVKEIVYYNQGEEPWASCPYGSSTIKTSGCGPTALAIVISTLTGEKVNPQMTADFAAGSGLYVPGKGTSHSFPSLAAKHWGLSVERVQREEMETVIQELKRGKLAVVICAENTISKSGHFIVLTGVTESGFLTIADPGSRARTGNLYSPSTIQSYARNLSDGSIWLIGEDGT